MSDHRYTVAEIDALRTAIGHRVITSRGQHFYMNGRPNESWTVPTNAWEIIEDQLRTYMLAGLTADDFRNSTTHNAEHEDQGR